MTKNYADIYNSSNDSVALEQRFYLKEETTRGTFVPPTGADFFFHLPGGQITYEQPFESSTQRSGRHHQSAIVKKKSVSWGFSTYFNINTGVAAGATEIDPALRVLWKSLLGKETVSSGLIYDPSSAPSTTFSLFEIGDKWSRQAPGAFVQGGNIQLPGDGEASVEWSGMGKTAYMIGIGKSTTDNSASNDVELESGEAENFVSGGLVMIIEANGTTRSADTPDGSPRTITAVNYSTDVVTLSGAALADADGSVTPIYLVYYEPATPVAIDNPQTGLVGQITVQDYTLPTIRSLGISLQNNHEVVDYAYGEDGLAGSIFVPGDRLTAEISLGHNLNRELASFFNSLTRFQAKNVTAYLGAQTSRHAKFELPNVRFQVPGFAVPDTGSIPVEFSGTAYQTGLDLADEVKVKFL